LLTFLIACVFKLPDFNGKELSLSLDQDGCLGSFEASPGINSWCSFVIENSIQLLYVC
jgi:hypothetical protein